MPVPPVEHPNATDDTAHRGASCHAVPLATRCAGLGVSGVLYVAACALPALTFRRNEDGVETWLGIQTLCLGWLGVLLGQFAWLSNLFLLAAGACLLLRWWIAGAMAAGLGLVVAAHTFSLFGTSLPGDEGDVNKLWLTALGAGFYLWCGSQATVLAACVAGWARERWCARFAS